MSVLIELQRETARAVHLIDQEANAPERFYLVLFHAGAHPINPWITAGVRMPDSCIARARGPYDATNKALEILPRYFRANSRAVTLPIADRLAKYLRVDDIDRPLLARERYAIWRRIHADAGLEGVE